MIGNSHQRKLTGLLAATALIAASSSSVSARPANQMTDLVGARASSGESQLEARGFTHITTSEGAYNTKHAYWWNSRDKNCLHVETYDGRYTAITDGTPGDCHQKSGGNAGAAVGAVAGVALLAALLSHKSHNHDDGQHHAAEVDEQQYDRGFNDGLHNTAYHNYDRSDFYARGYQAGVTQRSNNTRSHSGRGGYTSAARISDLNGADAVWAIDQMSNRGFANVDTFTSGSTIYGIFYNRSTRQCVQMTNADSRVYDIREIGQHPKCR
jgi:major membrane immunogen (membrane-anchored lipoprotein)